MKSIELRRLLWQAVKEADELPLSPAEERLHTALHLAVLAYDDELRLGQPPTERRCLICGARVSQCCC